MPLLRPLGARVSRGPHAAGRVGYPRRPPRSLPRQIVGGTQPPPRPARLGRLADPGGGAPVRLPERAATRGAPRWRPGRGRLPACAGGASVSAPPVEADLEALERAALELTRQAGALVMAALRQPPDVEYKDERRSDPVTATDRAVEELFARELGARFPQHGLLGEEGAADTLDAEYLWVADPLDGTANFANGLPLFAVSLALLHRGAPIVGCLFVPLGPAGRAGVLHAARGRGAFFEGEPLRVAAPEASAPRLAGLPSAWPRLFRLRGDGGKVVSDARSLGSICLECALVASGALRWACFGGPRLWDVAAGTLLVREAGGLARTWDGRCWQDLERFVAPAGRAGDGTPRTLRHWSQPVLLGEPASLERVAASLAWRRGLPRLVRRLLRAWSQRRRPKRDGAQGRGAQPLQEGPREAADARTPP